MPAETRQLDLVLKLQDKASKELKTFGGRVKGLAPTFEKMTTAAGAALLGLGAGFAIAGKEAAQFEATMADISTLISGNSMEAVEALGKGVKEMARSMPKSLDELGGSLYDVLSAGIQGTSEQLFVLESAGKLAVAGLGDVKGATDVLTSSINAFGLDAKDSNKIIDVLFKTVKNGKTTVDQIAQSFGTAAPIVAAAGISLEEFSAATAALTTTGLPASVAQNQLRAATLALQAPTKDMTKLFKKAGIASGEKALRDKGLVEVMLLVEKAAKGDAEAMKKAFGSVEALGAVTSLTGDQFETFNSTMADMEEGANAVDVAFMKQSETFQAQMQVMKNEASVLAIEIGTELLPIIKELIFEIKPLVEGLSRWITKHPELTKNILVTTTAIAGIVWVMGKLSLAMPGIVTGLKLIAGAAQLAGLKTAGLTLSMAGAGGLIAIFAVLTAVAIAGAIKAYGELKESQDEVITSMNTLGDSIDYIDERIAEMDTGEAKTRIEELNKETKELRLEAERLAGLGFWEILGGDVKKGAMSRARGVAKGLGLGKVFGVNDAVITPKGDVIKTNPKDFLIATKTPGELAGAGGGNINIAITGGTFLDRNAGEQLAELLSENLRRKLRL